MFVCSYFLSGNQEEISQGEKLGVAEDWRGQAGAENHNSDLSSFLHNFMPRNLKVRKFVKKIKKKVVSRQKMCKILQCV